jgi:tetratricopeptide (TPR) repeat protein
MIHFARKPTIRHSMRQKRILLTTKQPEILDSGRKKAYMPNPSHPAVTVRPEFKTIKLLFVFIVSVVVATPLHSESLSRNQQIQTLIQNFQYDKALSVIDSALIETPASSGLYASKGFVLRELYAFDKAATAYQKALSLDTTNNNLRIEVANSFKLTQDYASALLYYEKALAKDTANLFLQLERATCELLNDQYLEAIGDFADLWHKENHNIHVIKSLGFCFNKTGRMDEAIECYKIALKINPIDEGSVMSLANLFLKTKNYKEGIEVTEQFRVLVSNNSEVNSMNALMYLSNKDIQTATQRFGACLAAGDDTEFNLKNLGICYYSADNYDAAKEILEKAHQKDTTDVSTLHYLGISCYRSFYKELGIKYLEKAIELYQPSAEKITLVYKNYAEACVGWSSCTPEKKLSALLNAYRYNPGDSILALELADTYEHAKNYPKAVEYLELFFQSLPVPTSNTPADAPYRFYQKHLLMLREKASSTK